MHEMSIASMIIDQVESIIIDQGKPEVEKIGLKVGKLKAVVVSSLKFCFNIMSEGTIIEGAELVVEEVPIRVICQDCQKRFVVENYHFNCPFCSSTRTDVISGEELQIEFIKIVD